MAIGGDVAPTQTFSFAGGTFTGTTPIPARTIPDTINRARLGVDVQSKPLGVEVTIKIEESLDGGVTWPQWWSATMNADDVPIPGVSLSIGMPLLAGTSRRVRGSVIVVGGTFVTTGGTLDIWT